ncbi:MAG TPA: DMT family transporter [Caulobacteraceae bacterium]|nr:DMT family transporter [Caulobacteraceae bacterium]
MHAWVAVLVVLISGTLVALQAPTNAVVARAVNSPVNAALVSFAVGTAALLVAAFVLRVRPDLAAVKGLPWWAWLGGLYGAVFVAAAAFATPRIGVAATLTLLVAGQLVMAAALDHFGALGVPRQEITPLRLLGLALVAGGVLLVRRF